MKIVDVYTTSNKQHTIQSGVHSDRIEIHEEQNTYNGLIKFLEMRGKDVVAVHAYPRNTVICYKARNY